jgi:2-methylcitrate dehydratase PrpD
MIRRDFIASSLGLAASALGAGPLRASGASGAAHKESPKAPGLTKYVSEFIVNTRYEDIPEDVVALGKKSILDGFGVALAGSVSPIAPLVRKYIATLNMVGGQASIIGSGLKVPPRFAALANGIAIHSDDYDDTAMVPRNAVHATVPVLPPAFALCEAERCSGKDLMLAYHIGVEVQAKVATAMSARHYADGYHATGTIGSFGSAAACAKLRGLNALQTAYAFGVVGAEAGGVRENFGTMTKPFTAGHAAENGTVGADLAALGWTAATNILEGAVGYFEAAGGGFDPNALMNRLGKPWTFVSPGVLIKEFPCGTIQQPVMDLMLRLVRQNNLAAEQVEKIEVAGSHLDVNTLFHHRPTTGLEGKFSMEFGVIIVLLERKATLSQFTDAVVQRPDVQDLVRRTTFYADPKFDSAAGFTLKITLKDGKVIAEHAELAKGSPQNPMSYDDVAEKFRGNAEYAKWPSDKAERVIELVKTLENARDMTELTAALTD